MGSFTSLLFVRVNSSRDWHYRLSITARRFNELPSVSGLACVFALNAEVLTKAGKVPVDGRKFLVMIKQSRWRGPDKWAGFVMSR